MSRYRSAVALREQFGVRVNRLDPDQVADLVMASAWLMAEIGTYDGEYNVDQFKQRLRDAGKAEHAFGRAVAPFFVLLLHGRKGITGD